MAQPRLPARLLHCLTCLPPCPSPSLPSPPQVPDQAHADHLVLARLALARGDPLKSVDAREAVVAAAQKVASWMGDDALRQRLEQADPTAAEQLQQLLTGQPLEGSSGTNGAPSGSLQLGASSG